MKANSPLPTDPPENEGAELTLKTRTDGIEQLRNILKSLDAVKTVQYVEENGSNGELQATVSLDGDVDAFTMHNYNNTLSRLGASETVVDTKTVSTIERDSPDNTVVIAEITYQLSSGDDALFDY